VGVTAVSNMRDSTGRAASLSRSYVISRILHRAARPGALMSCVVLGSSAPWWNGRTRSRSWARLAQFVCGLRARSGVRLTGRAERARPGRGLMATTRARPLCRVWFAWSRRGLVTRARNLCRGRLGQCSGGWGAKSSKGFACALWSARFVRCLLSRTLPRLSCTRGPRWFTGGTGTGSLPQWFGWCRTWGRTGWLRVISMPWHCGGARYPGLRRRRGAYRVSRLGIASGLPKEAGTAQCMPGMRTERRGDVLASRRHRPQQAYHENEDSGTLHIPFMIFSQATAILTLHNRARMNPWQWHGN
jgi:hypothetical protein